MRSRIWGYHDSQDVTAEVFTRAWKSWPGYNPRRGPVAPWLFRIAQRTVADWYRRRPSDTPAAPESSDLEQLSGAPLVFWVLWRHFRRHRDRLAVWVGGVGTLALLVHLPLHFIPGEGGPLLFMVSGQFGVGLLLVWTLLDWRAMRRWTARQRAVAATA